MGISSDSTYEVSSTNNSSTSNLTAGASFTGTADRVDTYDVAHVSLFATQNCTIQVQQSSNGTNWDLSDSFTTTANVGFSTTVATVTPFLRVVVTNNGASTTTSFRLQTQFSSDVGSSPRALGQKTAQESSSVVIATDQSAIPVSQSGTWNINNVSGTVSLPTGASTSALQTTGNTSLSSIDTKTPTLGQKTMANSSPVVIASDQSTLSVTQLDGAKATYSASASFTFAASATDVFTITGSASKTIRIRKIIYYVTATSGANATVQVIRRSTANTGGTSSTRTAVAWDTTNSAATATVRSYTANPTLGTTVGPVIVTGIYISGGGTIGSQPLLYTDDSSLYQALTLRGTSEVIAINMNATSYNGNVARATIVWTEE